jgi:hypothetical protein
MNVVKEVEKSQVERPIDGLDSRGESLEEMLRSRTPIVDLWKSIYPEGYSLNSKGGN